MNVAVASDHRGVHAKERILAQLKELGHAGVDLGPNSDSNGVDYPDYATKVAELVTSGAADRGVLICGTGIGMCITANKYRGVRAVTCHDDVTAEMSRRHNDANIMCLSADLLGDRLQNRIVELWLNTPFEGGRHQRRLDKISDIESIQGCATPGKDSPEGTCCG